MKDPKGYYALLGLSPDCTADDIKAAFRRLAKEWHPDVSGPGGTEKFQALSQVYQTLSDPAARAAYEASPQPTAKPPAPAREFKLAPLCCSVCLKATPQPRSLIFQRVFSVIFVTLERPRQGIFCASCAHQAALGASLFTSLLGWWGLPWGPLRTIRSILRNLSGGERDRRSDEKMLWYNALAYMSHGDGPMAYGLAKLVAAARDPEIAGKARKLMQDLVAAGTDPASAPSKNAWALRPNAILAQFAMLCAVPLAVGVLAAQALGAGGPIAVSPPPAPQSVAQAPLVPTPAPAAPSPTPAVPTPAPAAQTPPPAIPEPAPAPAAETPPPTKKCILRPRTGQVLAGYAGSGLPANKVEIRNASGENAIVKIRDAATGNLAASFFVADKDSGSFNNLPNGVYQVQYAFGDDLGEDCLKFISTYAAGQFPVTDSFKTPPGGSKLSHHALSFTLTLDNSGAGEPSSISEAAFNAVK